MSLPGPGVSLPMSPAMSLYAQRRMRRATVRRWGSDGSRNRSTNGVMTWGDGSKFRQLPQPKLKNGRSARVADGLVRQDPLRASSPAVFEDVIEFSQNRTVDKQRLVRRPGKLSGATGQNVLVLLAEIFAV